MITDDFLDKYFRGTYVEWGMKQYMDKAKTLAEYIANHEESSDSIEAMVEDMTKGMVSM